MTEDQDARPEQPEAGGSESEGSPEAQESKPEEPTSAESAPVEDRPSEPKAAPAKSEKAKPDGAEPKGEKKRKEGQLTEAQANLLLIGLTVYVIVLAVLAVDQIFELGIIRPELDRLLIARIEKLEPAPPGVPAGQLAQLRQAAAPFTNPQIDPRLTAVGGQVDAEAYAFSVGSPPDAAALETLGQNIEKLRKAQPPVQDARAIDVLASLAEGLKKLAAAVPPDQAKVLGGRREASDYIINYHEFSIPHLIRALRKADPPGRTVARYCLDQIARRFFNYAGPELRTPEEWKQWWKRTEADLERRSRR